MNFLGSFFHHRRMPHMLAFYVDGELPQDEAARVRQHLESCARCRQELAVIIGCRELLKGGVAPPPVPAEQLWQRIIKKTSTSRDAWFKPIEILSSTALRQVGGSLAAAVLIFFGVAVWMGVNKSQRAVPFDAPARLPSSAIDYSIFLDDVRQDFAGGNFYKRYRAQLVSLNDAQQTISFPLAAIDALPESYRLERVRVFECNGQKCILFSCVIDGKTINIFQHALGQAWTLGQYAMARTPICNVDCLFVDAAEVAAVSWQGKNSEYLAVGDFTPQEIEQVVHVLQ
jgi:hypothetical protein